MRLSLFVLLILIGAVAGCNAWREFMAAPSATNPTVTNSQEMAQRNAALGAAATESLFTGSIGPVGRELVAYGGWLLGGLFGVLWRRTAAKLPEPWDGKNDRRSAGESA